MVSIANTSPPWELVDLNFIWRFRNKDATDYTFVEDTHVTMPELRNVLLEQGLRDPLILRISTNGQRGTIRLEEGNHRIQVLRVFNTHVPLVIELADTAVGHIGNGTHLYSLDMTLVKDNIKDLPLGKYLPSEIFN